MKLRGILWILVLVCWSSEAFSVLSQKKILIVHSYHQGLNWTDEIHQGMTQVLSPLSAEIYTQYLDARRIPFTEIRAQTLKRSFQQKYQGESFDLILVSDDVAFQWVMRFQKEIFKRDIPVVFSGVNYFNAEDYKNRKVWGVLEVIPLKETLEIMSTFFPKTRAFYVVSDESPLKEIIRKEIREWMNEKNLNLKFEFLDTQDIRALFAKISSLEPDSLLLLISLGKDERGRNLSFQEAASRISGTASVPVFSFWDIYIGYGPLGGKVSLGVQQGERAAWMASQIIQGKTVFPEIEKGKTQFLFDFTQLQRYGIPFQKIPEGSRIIHAPLSFYERFKPILWGLAAAILMLIFFVFPLLFYTYRLKIFGRKLTLQQQALKYEEEKNRKMLEILPVGICLVSEAQKIEYANPAFSSMMDVSQEELTGTHLPHEVNENKLFLEKSGKGTEKEITNSKGKTLTVFMGSEPMSQPGYGFRNLWYFVDLTEKKYIEEALLESRVKYISLFKNMQQAFSYYRVVLDENENVKDALLLEVNPAFEKLFEFPKAEVIGHQFNDIFPDSLLKAADWQGLFSQAALMGTPSAMECFWKEKGVWLEVYVYSPEKQYFVLLQEDITARKDLQAKIEFQHHFFQSVLDELPVPVYMKNENFEYTLVNRAFTQLFQKKVLDFIGKSNQEIFDSEQVMGVFYQNDKDMIIDNKKVEFPEQLWLDPFSGEEKYFKTIKVPFAESSNEIRILGVSMDITDLKNTQKKLDFLNKDLIQKNQELEQVLYAASHDLRSPLVNIQGFSKELDYSLKEVSRLLEEHSKCENFQPQILSVLGREIPESLDFILASIKKMDHLINGILAISRVGKQEVHLSPLNMDALMDGIMKSFQYQLQATETGLYCESLPNCFSDSSLVSRVFSNLIENAIKYRHPSRRGEIHVSGEAQGEWCVYTIQDNGVGIPEAYLEKIFQLFYRVSHSSNAEGEGIGLSVTRKMMMKLGGEIRVESVEGEGSRFTLTLPRGTGKKY